MQIDPRVIRNVLVIIALLVLGLRTQKSGEPSTDGVVGGTEMNFSLIFS
ncbi:MAG TPA: hypothetical protein VFT90_12715 [Chryseosolibacter sp.]|nr:hypothetical protein [Chryseosolibacter sp.]